MPAPPEVLLDRYLKSESRSRKDRANYKGKQDLALLEPSWRSLLTTIQLAMNEALRLERANMSGHFAHPRFHFDYVDAMVPNAIAFQSDDFAFIGVTLPLIGTLWRVCTQLSQSTGVMQLFGLEVASTAPGALQGRQDAFHAHLFSTQLNFIAAHEYTHHVHGHDLQLDSGSEFCNEILGGTGCGRLEDQAKELDADGYATNFVLSHMIQDAERRKNGLTLLGRESVDESTADKLLMTSFVVAVGGFFHFLPMASFDATNVYELSHPPAPARMNNVIHHAQDWCKRHRPTLHGWLIPDRYKALVGPVSDAAVSFRGESNWNIQNAFLRSDAGRQYLTRVYEAYQALLTSLPREVAT